MGEILAPPLRRRCMSRNRARASSRPSSRRPGSFWIRASSWAASSGKTSAFLLLPELASCELKAVEGGQTTDMLTCPLKLGSQGFDMIHIFLRTFGIGKDYGESGVEKKADAHAGDVGWSTPHKSSGGFFNKMFNR